MGKRAVGTVVIALALLAGPESVAGAATIGVDTNKDELNADGDCSLREAVQAANVNAAVDGCNGGQASQRDVVELKPKNYELTVSSTDEDANLNGDLDVLSGGPLTILGIEQGGGSDLLQDDDDRIIDLASTQSDLTIEKTDLTGGDVTSFSTAEARGGSIRVTGGGAKLKLRRVGIENANGFVGGAIYASNQAKLKILDSDLTSNEATGTGGAIATANSAKTTLKGSTLLENSVTSVTDTVEGGAISHSASTGKLTVIDSSIVLNQLTGSGAGNAALGGGIYVSGPAKIRRSFVASNTATATTVGTAEHGGGVYQTGGSLDIVNSTFFQNDAGNTNGLGGAVYVGSGVAELQFTTFASNTASSGGDSLAQTGGTLDLGGSILDDDAFGTPCSGTVISLGFNVSEDEDPDCGFVESDAIGVENTGLDNSASENGGRTATVAIEGSSPAKNFVPKKRCKPARGEDQRGFKRPAGKKCDAGAFEFGANGP